MESNFPTPEELAGKEKEKELLGSGHATFPKLLEGVTERQRKLILLTLTRPDLTDKTKCELAGFSVESKNNVSQTMSRIQGKLGDVLLELGITQGDIARSIRNGLYANKHNVVKVPEYNEKNQVIGYRAEIIETPDHQIRMKYAEMLLKLGDYFPAHKIKGEMKHTHELSQSIEDLRNREKELTGGLDADYEVVESEQHS